MNDGIHSVSRVILADKLGLTAACVNNLTKRTKSKDIATKKNSTLS